MESESPGGGGTLLVLEPKSLRSFNTNDEYLYAMKEDLADWFACLYKLQIEAETFLSILETGVILCRHANEVQHFFKERRQQGPPLAMRSYFIRCVPEGHVICRTDVKPGTFQARDNVSNFISWCRNLGIPDVLRFETDDLVLRKNEKSVILCLLELARVGAKLGMLAPTIVQMEQEIDEELESGLPPPQIKTCDMKSLDELVRELIGQCSCPVQFPMIKVGEGKYQIGDSRTLIFVRVLRNHVMVRVGGGWDTLENYLDKHDPCRCHYKGHRSGAGNLAIPRHQIQRQASASAALIAIRTAPTPTTSTAQPPSSPRRLSSAAVNNSGPPSVQNCVKSSSPGPASGVSKGQNPGPRSTSPIPAHFAKGSSPSRCASPTPSANGIRRLPSPASCHSIGDCRETRTSSMGRPASGLSRPSSPSVGQSCRPAGDQIQQYQEQPQHQAVQRCKSPSPASASASRTVSPALTGNRILPRPLSRGASGIPRPQSPALTSPARRQLFPRSTSFDKPVRTQLQASVISKSSEELDNMEGLQLAAEAEGGGEDKEVINMEQISTMTLSEFKKLITNNLSLPPASDGGQGGATEQSHSQDSRADPQNLSWSSVRDKARSLCNSLEVKASSRRPGAPGVSIIARRNQPGKSSTACSDINKQRTPSSPVLAKRPENTSTSGVERPKTPVTTIRPKTPVTSAYGFRSKTPAAANASTGEGGQPRPPTPSRKESNLTKVGSKSSETLRPKTPTSTDTNMDAYIPRVQNTSIISTADQAPSGLLVKNSSFVYQESDSAPVENSDLRTKRPTQLGVKSPLWGSSVDRDDSRLSHSLLLSNRSQSPTDDDLEGDNSEIAETMDGSGVQVSTSISVRDRPCTPSRIPRPAFASRPTTPSSLDGGSEGATTRKTSSIFLARKRSLPQPTTPVGQYFTERQLSAESGDSEKPSIVPRRHAQIARCITPNSIKSYTEIFYSRRAQTPGPGNSTSCSFPSSGHHTQNVAPVHFGARPQQQHDNGERSSLSRSVDVGLFRKSRSVTSLLPETERLSTVDIASDDVTDCKQGSNVSKRASSMDSQHRFQLHNTCGGQEHHKNPGMCNVRVKDQNRNAAYSYHETPSHLRQSASFDSEEERSRMLRHGLGSRLQHHPKGIIRKPNQPGTVPVKGNDGLSKFVNRTEAWVDSTLDDPKRKQPLSRPRRAMTPNSLSISESELMSRPLEEIQAALSSPLDSVPVPDPKEIEAPPEDPEMYKKMELLFEKYREMELRASVCETPGGDGRLHGDSGSSVVTRSSGSHVGSDGDQGSGQRLNKRYSLSSHSSSLRNSLTASASFSSGISSSGRSHELDHSRSTSVENDRFSKESSPAAAAAMATLHCGNGAASNNGDYLELSFHDGSACFSTTPRQGHQGAPAVSADDIVDIDAEIIASNPAALVTKIKEILQVRPRKEPDDHRSRTRIPAPAPMSRPKRSKSVSSLTNGESSSLSFYESSPNCIDVTRDESTNSDVSSDVSRCETPVPKLTQPLTTGRFTLFKKERSQAGVRSRSMSQDDHVSSSSSLSSSSRRCWDEEGEFV